MYWYYLAVTNTWVNLQFATKLELYDDGPGRLICNNRDSNDIAPEEIPGLTAAMEQSQRIPQAYVPVWPRPVITGELGSSSIPRREA